jgi:hypothetical protein
VVVLVPADPALVAPASRRRSPGSCAATRSRGRWWWRGWATRSRSSNAGRAAPVLVAHGQPQLLPKKPLNPTDRVAFTPTAAGLVDVVDESTPHLRGRALVVDHALYALPDASGKFEFADVPAGEWTVRVFYAPRNLARAAAAPTPAGWIDRTDDKVTIGAKKSELTLKLPPALPVKP